MGVADVLANARSSLAVVVACASSSTIAATSILQILRRSVLRLVDRHERHVNRRTGRRAGEYYESILVAVAR